MMVYICITIALAVFLAHTLSGSQVGKFTINSTYNVHHIKYHQKRDFKFNIIDAILSTHWPC